MRCDSRTSFYILSTLFIGINEHRDGAETEYDDIDLGSSPKPSSCWQSVCASPAERLNCVFFYAHRRSGGFFRMDYSHIFLVSSAGVSLPCRSNNFDDVRSVTVQKELAAETRVGLSEASIPLVAGTGEG